MISNLSKEAWNNKVIDLGGSILQSWSWGIFNESLGHKIHRFSDNNFANLAIETELALGKKYLYCPRGPLGDFTAALLDLKKFRDDKDFIFARIEPLQPVHPVREGQIGYFSNGVNLPRAVKDMQPVNNWMLDLNQSDEELLVGMKPKTRYNINLAQRKGVTVRVGGQQDLIALWKLLLETAARTQIRLHPQNYYFKMWEALGQDHIKILIAEYHRKPMAGMIMTLFGDTAAYLHGGTSNQMKEAMSPYVLHWEAIRLAKNSGMANYDFGGIAPNDETRHAWAGISRFKKGFGGLEVKYPGSFDLIYSPIWYTIYKNARGLKKFVPRSR